MLVIGDRLFSPTWTVCWLVGVPPQLVRRFIRYMRRKHPRLPSGLYIRYLENSTSGCRHEHMGISGTMTATR